METITKSTQRTTDTLRQALSTLAALMDRTINEVNVLDSEIQDDIRHAVHEAQETFQKQSNDRQQAAIDEAVQKARTAVSEEFFSEVQRLTKENAAARAQVQVVKEEHAREMAETEESAAIALERQVSKAADRARAELTPEIDGLKSQLDGAKQMLAQSKEEFRRVASEKEGALKDVTDKLRSELDQAIANGERLKRQLSEVESANARIVLEAQEESESAIAAHKSEITAATERVRTQLTEERNRLSQQLDDLLHNAAQWDSERARFQNEIKIAVAAKDQALEELKKAASSHNVANSESIQTEVRRVEDAIHGISAVIDAPETELSVVIRKNVERAELESYLKGIRFVMSGK
jgi:chromosome segregation ATPase